MLTLVAAVRKAGLAAVLVAASFAAFPFHASAGPFTFVETRVHTRGPIDGGTSHADTKSQDSDTGASLVQSGFSQTGEWTASADAAAELGFLRGQNFARFPEFTAGDAFSEAMAQWGDLFTIDVAGHTGEEARFTAEAWVHGFVDITGGTDARVTTTARIGSGPTMSGPSVHVTPAGEFRSGTQADAVADGYFSFNEPFLIEGFITLGTPFQFVMSMLTEIGRFTAGMPGSGDIQMGNTITWNGITSVTVGGMPVPAGQYTFTSGSGLDYRQSFMNTTPPAPVPEPGTMLLVLGGMAGAGIRRRFAAKSR